MDLSDGLADAVCQVAEASGTGAAIDAAALPIPAAARAWFARAGEDFVAAAIAGGDDYELLFTVPRRARGRLATVVRQARGVPLTRIGALTAEPTLTVLRDGRKEPLPAGFVHFYDDSVVAASSPLARPAPAHDDTPQRTAAAFALGVFFGFSPILGFHTMLGLVFAFALDLNRVAVLLGVYSNLPWILRARTTRSPPSSAPRSSACRSGRGFLKELFDAVSAFSWTDTRALLHALTPMAWAYVLGSTIGRGHPCRNRLSRVPGGHHRPPETPRTAPSKHAKSITYNPDTPHFLAFD